MCNSCNCNRFSPAAALFYANDRALIYLCFCMDVKCGISHEEKNLA
jgi:hypothetical protein